VVRNTSLSSFSPASLSVSLPSRTPPLLSPSLSPSLSPHLLLSLSPSSTEFVIAEKDDQVHVVVPPEVRFREYRSISFHTTESVA
jgi:hypothetical protein